MKPYQLDPPKVELLPGESNLLQEVAWQPFPQTGPSRLVLANLVDFQRYQLYRIAADLLPLVLSGNADDSPLPGHTVLEPVVQQNRLKTIEQRMWEWYQNLPYQLKVNDETKASITDPVLTLM